MVHDDHALLDDPEALSLANRRFHKQIHLASHNTYLVQQLDLVHRSMALMATTSLAAEGRSPAALDEHAAIVAAIAARDGDAAAAALKLHLSTAFEVRLKESYAGWQRTVLAQNYGEERMRTRCSPREWKASCVVKAHVRSLTNCQVSYEM